MNRFTVRVLAIDPGSEHVGFSYGKGEEIKSWGTTAPEEFLTVVINQPPPVGRVVVERFDIRQFTRDSQITVELIGAIKWICNDRYLDIAFVNPSSKKKFIDSVPEEVTGHARDAEAIRLYDLNYGTW